MLLKLKDTSEKIKNQKPLILNLTNYVTQDFMANSLLGIGAAPIMSESKEEIEELVQISSVVNINIGTLNQDFIEKVNIAIISAKKYGKKIILDPVGAGATNIRTKTALDILPHVNIVRGNASEIMALDVNENKGKTLGVESTNTGDQALNAAINISKKYNITVIISGKDDYIIYQNKIQKLSFGSDIMPYVTGMGCTLTAIVAAFYAVEDNAYEASLLAVLYYTLCAEQAASILNLPAIFKVNFIDSLFKPDFNFMKKRLG